jgi:MFS family permease
MPRELVFFVLSAGLIKSPTNQKALLLVASAIDGLLGGINTIQAAISSYISDCTTDGSRANIFARFLGVFFFGIALGPGIGALLIRATGGITSVYLVSCCLFVANLLFVCFVLPESLTKTRRNEAKQAHDSQNEELGLRSVVSYPKSLLLPLRVFLPRKRLYNKHWDWSYTFLAGAFICSFLTVVSSLNSLYPLIHCVSGYRGCM